MRYRFLKLCAVLKYFLQPVSEMRIMGLCDHYICRDCLEKAPDVEIGLLIFPRIYDDRAVCMPFVITKRNSTFV